VVSPRTAVPSHPVRVVRPELTYPLARAHRAEVEERHQPGTAQASFPNQQKPELFAASHCSLLIVIWIFVSYDNPYDVQIADRYACILPPRTLLSLPVGWGRVHSRRAVPGPGALDGQKSPQVTPNRPAQPHALVAKRGDSHQVPIEAVEFRIRMRGP
jgi:hypothetical protein